MIRGDHYCEACGWSMSVRFSDNEPGRALDLLVSSLTHVCAADAAGWIQETQKIGDEQ